MLKCPVYATPFTARLIAGKLEEAGLAGRVQLNVVPLHGQHQARSVRDRVHLHHPFDPRTQCAGHPHAAGHGGAYRRLEDRSRSAARRGHRRRPRCGSWATKACWRWSAIPPMRWWQGESGSEATVREALTDLIGTLKGRVAVTAFASNVARLDTIAKAAKAHGREIALVGRAMHKIVAGGARHRLSGGFSRDARRGGGRRSAAEPRALSVHRQPGRAARGAGAHRRRRASQCQPGPGRRSDLLLAHHSGQRSARSTSCTTSWRGWAWKCSPAEDHFVHVSGHPARDELAQMYRWTRPKIAVPVHGELRHMTRACAPGAIAAGAAGPGASRTATCCAWRPATRRADRRNAVGPHPSGRPRAGGGRRGAGARAPLAGLCRHDRDHAGAGRQGRVAADPAIVIEGIPEPVHAAVREAVDEPIRRHNPEATEDATQGNRAPGRARRRRQTPGARNP